MKRISYIILLLFIAKAEMNAQVNPASSIIDKMSWLIGAWANIAEENQFYETWKVAGDGEYSAFSYMTMKGDTVFTESISLKTIENELFYIVNAGNQNDGQAVSFKLVSTIEGEFIFENPEHDFPQRIIYRNAPPDSLYARIEGMVEGRLRQEDFPMKRLNP